LSEQRKYRTWTAKQKLSIVLAGLRGDRSVKEVCREHQISDTLFYAWRDKLIEGGLEALAGKEERAGERAAAEDRRAGAGAGSEDVRARDRAKSLGGLGGAPSTRPAIRESPGASRPNTVLGPALVLVLVAIAKAHPDDRPARWGPGGDERRSSPSPASSGGFVCVATRLR
jgi:transposase-like protein